MNSLQATDDAAKAVQKTPNRVSLDSIKDKIDAVDYIMSPLVPHMTIAVVRLNNGYAAIGKSAPADPENYDEALGRQFAYEDAIRQVWPLEGYRLCEELAA